MDSVRADVESAPAARPRAAAEGPTAPCTPADSVPVPQPAADGTHDLERPEYYLNRELTWLNFNYRVLNEAEDERTPLLERVKFAAIVSANIDEFFQKRIGGLKQQVGAGVHARSLDGRTAEQQILECHAVVRDLEERKRSLLGRLLGELEGHDVRLTTYGELKERDRERLRAYYKANIFPLVTPQATDPAHPFPFISNLSLNLLVALRYPGEESSDLARVKVPVGAGIPRFVRVGDTNTWVTLESLMAGNLDLLFPGMQLDGCHLFRVTRNANTSLDEEQADDLLEMIEAELRQRRFAPVVRLQVSDDMPAQYRGLLAAEMGLDEKADVFDVEGMLAMRDLWEVALLENRELRDPPHSPVDHPLLKGDRNVFHILRDAGSVLLHHPYDAFSSSVERFLREASTDPKVRAIKMTLYRTSEDAKVMRYLIDAARNGKQVAVSVELKARFDEEANIRWANRLEEVGIHVSYGVVGLKTHCKLLLVVRQDYNGLRRYAHIGTGNYHPGTARLYSDLGLFTVDEVVGEDLTELFNYLTTGYKPRRSYRKILPAPKHLARGLLDRIEREIALQARGTPGHIQFKTNALEDGDVVRALYRASQAGVRVDLIVRDTCRLRPGIPGLSENVRVVSIVGRFLEHTRVYYFHNGGDEEYLIGSADVMRRNLNSRVECVVPVEAPGLRKELRFLLDTQLADPRSAWEMRADGSYVQRRPAEGKPGLGSQEVLIAWAQRRQREATRLRKRKPRGIKRRNIR